MEKKYASDWRAYLSTFEAVYPVQTGYVAHMVVNNKLSTSDIFRKIRDIVQTVEPDRKIHEKRMTNAIHKIKKIAAKKINYTLYWSDMLRTYQEPLRIPFESVVASPSSSNQAQPEPAILPVTNGVESHAPNGQSSHIEQDIMTWTKGEITMWLTKYSLENSSLLYLSGEEILFLHKLRYEAPEFFYRCLESKLHLESLLDLSRASDALADLTW